MTDQRTKKRFDRAREAFSRWIDEGGDRLETELEESVDLSVPVSGEEEPLIPAESVKTQTEIDPHVVSFFRKMLHRPKYRALYSLFSVCACLILIAGLLYTVIRLPVFGDADTLVNSEVMRFYNENTLKYTGSVNIICGIILNFRGFDTLGESFVLFIAVNTVMLLLLGVHPDPTEPREQLPGPYDVIPRTVTRIAFPLILVLGISVVVNGHLSPGGGFSGGAIMGAGLILYSSVMGFERTRRFFTMKTFRALTTTALSFYALSKLWHFLSEANGWESGISNGVPGRIFSAGLLLPLDVCVGIVVACTMYGLYSLFRRGEI